MRHRRHKTILGRTRSPRRSLLRHLAVGLILKGRVQTTDAKARALRPFVEKLVTLSRTPTLSRKRLVAAQLSHPEASRKLFSELGPRFVQRRGGYTRIRKLGRRAGDASPKSHIEFV